MRFVCNLFICVICLYLCGGVASVILKEVDVPPMVHINNEDDDDLRVILDCHYEIEDNKSFLVVKWLKDGEIAYQWIRGQPPSVFPNFVGKIEKNFAISTDPDQQYRGIALVNVTIDTSGVYRCLVQSKEGTYSKEKKLQIVDISNYTLNLFHNRIQNETHLECSIEHIYPQPMISLGSDDGDAISIISSQVNEDQNGYYNASTVAVVNDDDDDVDQYECVITFGNLPLNLTKTTSSKGASLNVFATLFIIPIFLIFN
ncbi:uncharacterized protein LOC119684869 [Teleopsis dalmanni]|uniref:uncharacterized protein LOC119684869 n=1 Tax=Teleopsis dalmanni TaxID=139649 RepID=UPI0018CCFCBD|nr:uncharacterized protein LOC119684869 [Teleopsis dalmanni]